MSRTLKILLLDKYADGVPDLADRGIAVQVTHERDWNKNVYEAPRNVIEKIEQLTMLSNFDLVVVGNNLGSGVLKAMAVHRRLRHRTVVVWNDDDFKGKEAYEKLGLCRFMPRQKLRDYIVTLVTN